MPTAHSPIGPQPVTSTVLAVTGALNTVYTALPNGSCMEAISGAMSAGFFQATLAGTDTYSAYEP